MKDLNTILNSIDISADWIGLREVCENKIGQLKVP